MKIIKIIKLSIIILLSFNIVYAKDDYFEEGLIFYKQKEFDKAKFKFEQVLVLNPKNENAYLYLSKIFNSQKNIKLEEQNLNSVILLNPENENAVFNLAKLKFEKSDFSESKKLINQLLASCINYCDQGKKLKTEIDNSIKK